MLNELEMKLNIIENARKKYKEIFLCGGKKSFTDSFTKHKIFLIFWFNTKDESTHAIFTSMLTAEIYFDTNKLKEALERC